MIKRYAVILVSLILGAVQLTAGISGRITGQVADAGTGEPLAGFNIMLTGTYLGAASDENGYYSILNVPPGEYSLTCTAIGYRTLTVEHVKVSVDLSTHVDFPMITSAVEMGEVVVIQHKKELITRDLTASTAVVRAEDIAVMPVENVGELLNMQAGMVDGHARGGRSGEIMYAIDGVPVTDVYDGSQIVDVNKNMVNELQFISGAFNAEYGRAMSGYVNIVTKDADNSVRAGVDTYIGDYCSLHDGIWRDGSDLQPSAVWSREAYLNFPLLKDRLFFFGNIRNMHDDGYMNAEYIFNPWDITWNLGASLEPEERYIIQSTGDSSTVPMNWQDKDYMHGKLLFKPSDRITLNINSIYSGQNWQDYSHSYAYNPYGDVVRHNKSTTNSLTLTHMLKETLFYQAVVSRYNRQYEHYVYEDPADPRYTHYMLFNQTPNITPTFLTGGTNTEHFYRSTENTLGKIDVTWQVNSRHQLKFGGEYNQYKLDYTWYNLLQEAGIPSPQESGDPFVSVYIPDPDDPDENTAINLYTRKPVEMSAYIQDKIEMDELIINVGVRWDLFDANGYVLNDPADPDIYRPKDPVHIAMTMDERRAVWYRETTPKTSVSPRVGAAFPVTSTGVVHFSYGYFFQAPSFQLLYQNPEFKFTEATGNVGLAGNSDLEAEETVSGEIGYKQGITADMALELTAYFRDIRNLAGTRSDELTMYGGTSWYNQYQNSDFGFVRGIIIALDKRLSDNWSAALDYTLQVAKGNASDPNAVRNQILGGEIPEIQLIRLDFDQSHTVNANFSYITQNWGASLIAQYGSGTPYTPSESMILSRLLTNSETKPDHFNVDLNAYRSFLVAGTSVRIYARVQNIFDILNQNIVYGDSGTADFTWEEYMYEQSGAPELINTLGEYYRNPGWYSAPRKIEIGVSLDWGRK